MPQVFVKCFCNSDFLIDLNNESFIQSGTLRKIISGVKGFPEESLKLIHNGLYLYNDATIISSNSTVHVVLSLPGGKGGFGSMLRAIGAQIEKTTNREACRDLSGRRLRDINEEQRLKRWISKQAEREEAQAKRRRERLESLIATPKHDFHDPNYDKQRSELGERIDDALTQGLQSSKEKVSSGEKRSFEAGPSTSKKQCFWQDVDDVSGDDETDEDDDESKSPEKEKEQCHTVTSADSSTNSMGTSVVSAVGFTEITDDSSASVSSSTDVIRSS